MAYLQMMQHSAQYPLLAFSQHVACGFIRILFRVLVLTQPRLSVNPPDCVISEYCTFMIELCSLSSFSVCRADNLDAVGSCLRHREKKWFVIKQQGKLGRSVLGKT